MKKITKRAVSKVYSTSPGLARLANKKSMLDLTAIADGVISSSLEGEGGTDTWDGDDLASLKQEGLRMGIVLAAMTRPKIPFGFIGAFHDSTVKIWGIEMLEPEGSCSFFFVGTYQEVAAKIRELPDEYRNTY